MDIQLLAVILLFGAAAFFIVRRIVRQLKGRKKAGCEKCGIETTKAVK